MEGLLKMCGFMCDLEEALGTGVDIVSEEYMESDFAEEVFGNGKLIYENHTYRKEE